MALAPTAAERSGRSVIDAAGAAVVGNTIAIDDGVLADNGFVDIGVVYDGAVNMHDRGVIGEASATPHAADEADTHVTEAIIYAAVVTDLGSPITGIESVLTAGPSPIRRRPERADEGSGNPVA